MAIRPEVEDFVALGTLPDSEADENTIWQHEEALHRITRPVSNEEAKELSRCFGPDDCYGLAWTLLHLIETAPGSPVEIAPEPEANEWIHRLWARSHPSE